MMIPTVLMGMVVLLIFLFLAPRIRLWSWLRFYHKVQRDFFSNRVGFTPKRTKPLEQPIPTCYNFIEADQFIAILADPYTSLQPKADVLRIISGAESVIKRQQQETLREYVRDLMHIPQLTVLVRSAILNLDQATLID